MTENVHPESSTAGASAVDQIAELLMEAPAEEPTPQLGENPDEVEYPDTDEVEVSASEADDDGDIEPDASNEQDDTPEGDEDGLSALAAELGLDADKLSINDDDEIMVSLKVNGEVEQVSLKDAIGQTQYKLANERKATALAEERKTFESERTQVAEAYQQRLQQIQGLGQMLEQKLMAEFQSVDWDRLRVTDPAEWSAKQQEFQMRQQELNQAGQALGQQMRQAQEQMEQQEAQERAQILQSERSLMLDSVPEWRDEEKMRGDLKEIVEYAQSVGFSDDELRDVVYNRHLQTLRKAMLYDKGKTVVEKKTRKVPKMQRAANGQFVSKKEGQVDRLIKRAQSAKGANKREAQADAVAAMLLGAQ